MLKSLYSLLTVSLLLTVTATAQDPKTEGNPVMHSFGAIGAQAVFSNYMAIAELADLFGAETYDAEKASQLATMYVNLAEAAKESLTDLVDSGRLNEGDEAAVNQMIVINDLLVKTAQAIVAYIETPSDESQAAYDKNRQKAWNSITKFLGIE